MGREALERVEASALRVQLARQFHNDAVAQVRRVRAKTVVRVFRLAGHAALPDLVDFDDRLPGQAPDPLGPDGIPQRQGGQRAVAADLDFEKPAQPPARTPMNENTTTTGTGTTRVKRGMAEMLKGGVIMDVVTPEQAKIAEDAGAVAVMALERVPADIRAQGGVRG